MINRAVVAGLVSTGIAVSDLRIAMPAVARHQLKGDDGAYGVHVRIADDDPEVVQVRFFQAPGIVAAESTLKRIERTYSRQEFRRMTSENIGHVTYPPRPSEASIADRPSPFDSEAIPRRAPRRAHNYR